MAADDSSSGSSSSSSKDEFLIPKSKSKSKPVNGIDSPANDQDDDADNINDSLQINTKYAKEYDTRKRREELTNYRQLKALGGIADSDDDESSDDESEDEDAELLTKDMDVKIIKTLRALKSKDEGIYDRNVKFFDEGDAYASDEEETSGDGTKKAKRKMLYKDVVREHILEDIEAEEQGIVMKDDGPRKQIDGNDLAYDKEQQEIRRAFLDSTHDAEEEGSESDNENWLKPKAKSKAEIDADQDEIKRLWEQEFASNKETTSKSLVDPKGEVQDPDKFLIDFMTNRKWLDSTDATLRKIQQADDESIESFQDKMDDFESKYNFRFEEAAAATGKEESGASHSIVHYARGSVGDNVLRRKDETRRQKRLSRKERKAEERKAKEEQLRRLKNAKREELEERMKQVRNVLGYDDGGAAAEESAMGAAEEDMILKLMEGEYDPEKFEQVMNATYGEDYYQQEDKKWRTDQDVKIDLAKVEDSDVVGTGDMYDDVDDEMIEEEAYPGDGMDDGEEIYDEEEAQWENEQYEESGMDKKLKAKMMDELYKLDYEDIIGDMPTRFKYRSVEANNYGLSTKEILLANDSALKQFVSLKKMAPYRDEGEYQPGTKKRKRFRHMLKSDREQMEQSDRTEEAFHAAAAADADQEAGAKKKKRRRQKKGSKKNSSGDAEEHPTKENSGIEAMEKNHETEKSKSDSLEAKPDNTESIVNSPAPLVAEVAMKDKKSKKDKYSSQGSKDVKKKKNHKKKSGVEGVSAARLASYGI